MNRKPLLLVAVPIFLFFSIFAFAFDNPRNLRDWEAPDVFERNQEETHTPLVPFNSIQEALNESMGSSPFYQSLNGTWKFKWASIPEDAPAEFYMADYNSSNWADIHVPGNWQMLGFGHPLFRNVNQPFPSTPPFVPSDYNPVGSYKRSFTIPDSWAGRQVFLHFEGVKSASYVWINGREAGYNQGGMEPAEYNITPFLRPGENTVSVQVYRYSDGTYLEDQDMWRLAGIYRSVYLMSTPSVFIRDFFVHGDLDNKYKNGILKIDAEINNYSLQVVNGYSVRANLYDADGNVVFEEPIIRDNITVESGSTVTVNLSQKVKNPRKWSAEHPNLYKVTLELLKPDGTVTEALGIRTGFRKVEVKNRAVYVNGVAVKFNGVNSHVHHPVTGRTMDTETMKKDLKLMKQFNINCVRTSHYPPNREYLDLADEIGMYIVDETGDEAHSTIYLSKDPAWREAYLDRARKMVKRDRNHPSVIIWSAGNESGSGENIGALIGLGKQLDPSRPAWLYGGNTDLLPFEDIVGPRYPHPDELDKVGRVPVTQDARPSFMDEYLAATGNSLGHLEEYWELIYKYPRLTGGAIWDWVSPGIRSKVITTPDLSRSGNPGYLMGRPDLVEGKYGHAVALSGHDDWVELYRHPALDITGDRLTLEAWVFPGSWNGTCPFITKGNHQYGLLHTGKDTLEFYIYSGERVTVRAAVPDDWESKWHHIAGVYDGAALKLYIDKQEQGATAFSGKINRGYFPVNIGKNVELHGQEHPGQLCNAVMDNVRIYDTALTAAELGSTEKDILDKAVLCLNFDETGEAGEFFFLGIGGRSYGLIWPDRMVQPELWQLKKTPQPVKVEVVDLLKGKVKITNRYNFTNLKELFTTWALQADDKTLHSGILNLDISAGESKNINLPYTEPQIEPGVEYRLLLVFALAKDTMWAPKGHEVAWEQLTLPWSAPPKPLINMDNLAELTFTQEDQVVRINGQKFIYTFDKTKGTLSSIKYNGAELLKEGPRINLWRAPTANETERDWGGGPIVNLWRAAGLHDLRYSVKTADVSQSGDKIIVTVDTDASARDNPAGFNTLYTYTFLKSGDIVLTLKTTPYGDMPEWLSKVGLQLKLPNQFDNFTWYGRGPFETYPDRKTGAKINVYSGMVKDQYTPYLIPQDYGNKTDVRWATLTNTSGTGLLVSGTSLLNVSAQHFSTDNLSRALYPFQLVPDNSITLNVDYLVSGVGGTPIKTLKKYRVLPKEYEFTLRFRPFNRNDPAPLELGKQRWVE